MLETNLWWLEVRNKLLDLNLMEIFILFSNNLVI